jgi:hypothetical protein
MPKVGRADFAYRVIIWDSRGRDIYKEIAGVDDLHMANACYDIAVKKYRGVPVTLQQGARKLKKSQPDL